ncbi:MAG: hypothetical protein Q8L09_03965 [Candidatus Moranbacteria bacterium]|nr:hypothetical protein [Candidatus Moranbacteria bacterium]
MKTPIELLEEVAGVLERANVDGTFTGGAVLPLYLEPAVAAELRPTFDIDVIVRAGTYAEYQAQCRPLVGEGFAPGQEEGDTMCRFRRAGVVLDVMPTPYTGVGTDNPWFPLAVETAVLAELPGGRRIRIVSAPLYLATKIAAFNGRGGGDHFGSKDMEDIVALLDGRVALGEECHQGEGTVAAFVQSWATTLLAREDLRDVLAAHVSRSGGADRWRVVLERVLRIAGLQ